MGELLWQRRQQRFDRHRWGFSQVRVGQRPQRVQVSGQSGVRRLVTFKSPESNFSTRIGLLHPKENLIAPQSEQFCELAMLAIP